MIIRAFACQGASLLAFAAPAFAQADPPQAEPATADALDDTGELAPTNEIVVSARRREESVQDVPQTVNVVTSAQIEKLNLRNFTDIQSVVPGLTLTSTSAFSNSATVRGVAFNPELSGANATVEFYLNDAPISSAFLFQSVYDVGQFELQRGPQGTLRGRAAPSGSISFTSRRPDLDKPGLVINGSLTNIHAQKLDGAINVPIVAGVLAVRVAGVIDESQANRVFTIQQSVDANRSHNPDPFRHTKSIRASVRFEPTDWVAFNFMYQGLNAASRTYQQVASASLFGLPDNPATRTIRPFDRLAIEDQGSINVQDQDVFIGNADLRFAGQKLSYVGSYNKQDNANIGPNDAADFFSPPGFPTMARIFGDPAGFEAVCQEQGLRADVSPTNNNFFQCGHLIARRESHELRIASEDRIAGIFDYVAGAFYDYNEFPNFLTNETPLLAGPTTFAPPQFGGPIIRTSIVRSARSTEKSAFGNLTAHLGKLEVSGGLRYIYYKYQATIQLNGVRPVPDIDDKFNATVYQATAKYQITPDIMAYAQTGSSWRPGVEAVGNFTTMRTARESRFISLPPERSKSYEVGLKTSFLDGRGRFNISAYHQDFENYQFRGPSVFFVEFPAGRATQVGSFPFVAAVPVKVDGVEAEASFQILPRWSIGANASYADGRIKNGTIACNDIDGNGIPDVNPGRPSLVALQTSLGGPAGEHVAQCAGISQRATFTPKFSANLQSEIGFGLGEAVDGFARGLYTFTGKNAADPANDFDDVGAFGLLNLYAGVRDPDGAWEVTVFGKNILRERKVILAGATPISTTLSSFPGSGVPQAFVTDYLSVSTTPPREFGVSGRIALGSR